jgi:hypothetical protein
VQKYLRAIGFHHTIPLYEECGARDSIVAATERTRPTLVLSLISAS